MRLRNYCVTYFKHEQETIDEINNKVQSLPALKYGAWQFEKCPRTSKIHLQGYWEFSKALRVSALQKLFRGIHCEARQGSRTQARDYCLKDDTRFNGPYEYGEWKQSRGNRNDLKEIQSKLNSGATEREISEEYFGSWCRYYKSFKRYKSIRVEPRAWKTQTYILWGDAGTGKTRWVYDTFGRESVYDIPRPNGGSIWFDGYEPSQHTTILFDDFYGWCPLHLLLKLCDRYPMQVPIKGGHTPFNAKQIVFTSNKHYDFWYDWIKHGSAIKDAFTRRIDQESYYKSNGEIVISGGPSAPPSPRHSPSQIEEIQE